MARLRHIAVCVKDLEKAAKFYETVFEMKEVGRETIEIGSAIYMSDGVINMALLNFAGAKGNDDAKSPEQAGNKGNESPMGNQASAKANDVGWASVIKRSPENGAKLRKLSGN